MNRLLVPKVSRSLLCLGVGVLLVAGALAVPMGTQQGVDFQVSVQALPLWVKATEFVSRDYHYRTLSREITHGLSSDRQRVLAIFHWTRRHIRQTPDDWTVVDDHILHIIIRGHGESDQMADVFTTLLVYAGVPAFWKVVRAPQTTKPLVLSLAQVEGRWIICDVAQGFIFNNPQGDFASVEEIAADPALVVLTAGTLELNGIPYVNYFSGLVPPRVPDPLRAKLQMPWTRLWYEARQRVIALRMR